MTSKASLSLLASWGCISKQPPSVSLSRVSLMQHRSSVPRLINLWLQRRVFCLSIWAKRPARAKNKHSYTCTYLTLRVSRYCGQCAHVGHRGDFFGSLTWGWPVPGAWSSPLPPADASGSPPQPELRLTTSAPSAPSTASGNKRNIGESLVRINREQRLEVRRQIY